MQWHKVESANRPQETDTTSSKKWNYIRKNITEEIKTDDQGNEYITYVFDERKIAKDNWGVYLQTEQNAANIDYIAIMSDIDL